MKSINVTFEDEEMKHLKTAKGKLSWRFFILKMLDEVDGDLNKNEP
jgi:hypothetical protein